MARALSGFAIIGLDRGVMWLESPKGVTVALIDDDPNLAYVVDNVLSRTPDLGAHFVLVGGDLSSRTTFLSRRPRLQPRPFHHVDAHGNYEALKSVKFAPLEEAARLFPEVVPFSGAELAEAQRQAEAVHGAGRDFIDALNKRSPTVTYALAAACVVMFGLQYYFGAASTQTDIALGANLGRKYGLSEPWRLLASAFLHANLMHLVFNMMALISFGPLLERVLGAPRYIVLYFLAALGGSALSWVGHEVVVSVGASGALWGLMCGGAGLVMRPGTLVPETVRLRLKKQVWMPVMLNGMYSFTPGVDWLAHLGGGLVGFALIASGIMTIGLTPISEAERPPEHAVPRALAFVSMIVMLASVGIAFAKGRVWELNTPPALERRAIGDTGLSIELPAGFKETHEPNAIAWAFGSLDTNPLALEVIVTREVQAVDDEGKKVVFAEIEKEMTNRGIEGATKEGALRHETVGGVEYVVRDDVTPLFRIRTWMTYTDRHILVRAYSAKSASDAWRALPEKIVASLKKN